MFHEGSDDKVTAANWLHDGLLANARRIFDTAFSSNDPGAKIMLAIESMRRSVALRDTDPTFVYHRLTVEQSARLHRLESMEFVEHDANLDIELKSLRKKAWGVE